MDRVVIEKGMRCFATTKLSRAQLLCTIDSVQGDVVTLKLPCIIKGYSHIQIHVKDIVLQQQSNKPKESSAMPPRPEDNPYRRHLENMLRNPAPQVKKPEPIKEDDKGYSQPAGDLLELTLRDMCIEERREYIEALGEAGKVYQHLLEEK